MQGTKLYSAYYIYRAMQGNEPMIFCSNLHPNFWEQMVLRNFFFNLRSHNIGKTNLKLSGS